MGRHHSDPERSPRPKGGRKDKAPHHALGRTTVEHWQPLVIELLSDDKRRTLNAIGVELIDKTADITGGTALEEALWGLVDDKTLEATCERGNGCIFFRRTQ